MQQRRTLAIALGILQRVANQPVQVVPFELVGGPAQGNRVADPVQAGTGSEHIMERQGA